MQKLLPKIPKKLVDAYKVGKVTIKEVARQTNRSIPCAFQHLVRQGYKPRERCRDGGTYEITKEQYEAYIGGKKNVVVLAKEVGCSGPTIRNLLRKFGFGSKLSDYRKQREAAKEKRYETVFESYVSGKTLGEIAEKLGVTRQRTQQMIAEHLKKNGVRLEPKDCPYRCSECKEFLLVRGRKPKKVICGNCCRDRLGPLANGSKK